MKALITGASSGIGLEIAKVLDKKGYEIILVARSIDKLEKAKKHFNNEPKIIIMDLSKEENVKDLYKQTKNENIDILVNNAGFGACGFSETIEVDREIEMINTNVKALHILTKLFLNDMIKKDSGYILNVSSSASFLPGGPLMTTYYATKAYVTSFTNGIWYELKKRKSNVHISALCPGPVDTNFNNVANVKFSVKPMKPDDVARYAVKNLFKKKRLIIPGFGIRFTRAISKFATEKFLLKFTYGIQEKKIYKK